MKYQDTWIKGACVERGKRECESRYNIIKNQCLDLPKNFSVLDVGANNCYFGIRLREDFDCNVLAFEFDHFSVRQKIVEANNMTSFALIKKKLSLDDLNKMNKKHHFNLVLCLSVLHHLPGNSDQWLEGLNQIGDKTIVEFALSDSKRTRIRNNYYIPEHAQLLGYGKSHLKRNFNRPIMLL